MLMTNNILLHYLCAKALQNTASKIGCDMEKPQFKHIHENITTTYSDVNFVQLILQGLSNTSLIMETIWRI